MTVVLRCVRIAVHAFRLVVILIWDALRIQHVRRFPAALASTLETLGGVFVKLGQALASRADLVDPGVREALAHLCDHVRPLRAEETKAVLREALRGAELGRIAHIELHPLASGSVAQLHRVELIDGSAPLLLKVRRSDASAKFTADLAIMTFVVRVLAKIPWFAPFSLDTAFGEIGLAATQQLDFVRERSHHAEVRELLAGCRGILVPALHPSLCSESALAMQYVCGARRIDDPHVDGRLRQEALAAGLRAVYAMLFERGVVHCDLHPGNLLVTAEGTLVLLDFGYMSRMDDRARHAFASLFLAIATADTRRAIRVILETAAMLPAGIDEAALEADLQRVLGGVSGASVGEFRIAAFVLELFEVQRRHRIRASSAFVMAIMSLLSYEGLLRAFVPSLEFQREAVPFVLRTLQTSAEGAG